MDQFDQNPRYTYVQGDGAYWNVPISQPIAGGLEEGDFKSFSGPPQIDYPYMHPDSASRHLLTTEWASAIQHQAQRGYVNNNIDQNYAQTIPTPLQPSRGSYGPQYQTTISPSLQEPVLQETSMIYSGLLHPMGYYNNELRPDMMGYSGGPGLQSPPYSQAGFTPSPMSETLLDSHSPSSSDSGAWHRMDYTSSRNSFESYAHPPAIADPTSSLSITPIPNDGQSRDHSSTASFASFDNIERSLPLTQRHGQTKHGVAPNRQNNTVYQHGHYSTIRSQLSSGSSSPVSALDMPSNPPPPTQKKGSISKKTTKSSLKKADPAPPTKKAGAPEKRLGKRTGPLLPQARKQAGEIRRLRACLRCKFLKKTCDTNETCIGCLPSHARLWQVPCTRLNIQDLGYFTKDWNAPYEQQKGVKVWMCDQIVAYAPEEFPLWITHGFGKILAINARQICVSNHLSFSVEWVETLGTTQEQKRFGVKTSNLAFGAKGVPVQDLSDYVDLHIDGGFEAFVADYFEGTPFLTDLLLTAYSYYRRTNYPIVRKALKLIVAYNLSMHITMFEGLGEPEGMLGRVEDADSKNYGRYIVPVLINFEIKQALAKMWRDLMEEVLQELQLLYTGVYSGDKLKNWPTIFILDSLLLAVWEEMQFDHLYFNDFYETPNLKLLLAMEDVPVGVIVGLFTTISQKMPVFAEWDTAKHGHLLKEDAAAWQAMSEVRQHIMRHDDYLKCRSACAFDPDDFDSLSNKLVSRLVIRRDEKP